MQATSTTKTPCTIVTGFLGSGKTTIISHLIDVLQAQGEQVVFVKNEIGDLDLDTKIMQGKHIQTRELLNGCICCTLVGPFISAIEELIATTKPDRIIIEASGAADTASLALMVSGHPLLIRDAVITIVDVVNFEGDEELTVTTRNQAKFTDLIVFNKVELADLAQKQRVVGYVRELNELAPIVEAPQGRLNPDLVFGVSTQHVTELLKTHSAEEASNQTTHSHETDHVVLDQIEGFHFELPTNLTKAKLISALESLPKNIFRIKGLVKLSPENTYYLVNRVGVRTTIEPFSSSSAETSTLIFIGFKARTVQPDVEALFSA